MTFDKKIVFALVAVLALSVFVYATVQAPAAGSSVEKWFAYLNARIVELSTNGGSVVPVDSGDNSAVVIQVKCTGWDGSQKFCGTTKDVGLKEHNVCFTCSTESSSRNILASLDGVKLDCSWDPLIDGIKPFDFTSAQCNDASTTFGNMLLYISLVGNPIIHTVGEGDSEQINDVTMSIKAVHYSYYNQGD
ncbi:MAG: hypothetical protein NTZ73_03150 [Candidatus Diapherotrites archaeon]|nr:hypothetical protein [Candidatus Diapherotrites archaeon]